MISETAGTKSGHTYKKEEIEKKERLKLLQDNEYSPAYIQNLIQRMHTVDEVLERLCRR